MNTPVIGLPGVGASLTATPRELFAGNVQFAQFVPGIHVIDGSKSRNPLNTGQIDVLLAGMLFGQITSSRKFAPSIIGMTTTSYATGTNTSISVSAVTATEIVRRVGSTGTLKFTGPPTTAGTVATVSKAYTAVNTSTGVITLASDLGADFVGGTLVTAADGSETIKTVLGNRWGVKVTDYTGQTSVDVLEEQFVLAGHLRTAAIVNYPADASLKTYVKAAIRAYCAGITFDDDWV